MKPVTYCPYCGHHINYSEEETFTYCPKCDKDIPILKWMVYRDNINRGSIEPYNIFSHGGFSKDVLNIATEDKESFARSVRSALMYHYWTKAEWEILLHPWSGYIEESKFKKIDVYDQVMNNWQPFIDYLWRITHI